MLTTTGTACVHRDGDVIDAALEPLSSIHDSALPLMSRLKEHAAWARSRGATMRLALLAGAVRIVSAS